MSKNMAGIYQKVREFKNKYPMTVSWRLKNIVKLQSYI